MLGDVLKNPSRAIANAKKSEKRVLELLLVNSLLIAAAAALVFIKLSLVSVRFLGVSLIAASTLFLLVFAGSLFFAYVLQLIVNTLGANGKYKDAVAALALSLTAPAAGFFISSLLFFIPLVGFLLSALIITLTFALGAATLYRAIKGLFRVDMLVSFISVSILILSIVVSVYSAALLGFMTKFLMVVA